ncbi:methionyl-tRNA formyltransferase [Malassezia sp. CBS 17886]|nr:methionyl-tRNA formyltransferase [Malassezia sp. CBS 17886]
MWVMRGAAPGWRRVACARSTAVHAYGGPFRVSAWVRWRHAGAARVPSPPYDVVFCGSDEFANASFRALLGRAAPVKKIATENAVPVDELTEDGMDALLLPTSFYRSEAPMLITASFGHRIPTWLLEKFSTRSLTLNVHPSLLPELRGAAPIQWAIAQERSETGVTVQQLHPTHFDRGMVLAQERVAVPDRPTYFSLMPALAERGAELLLDTIANLCARHARCVPQDNAQATRAPKLHRTHMHVRWDQWPAPHIAARLRAFGYAVRMEDLGRKARSTYVATSCAIHALTEYACVCAEPLAQADPEAHRKLLRGSDTYEPGTAVFSDALDALVIACLPGGDGTEPLALATRLQTCGKPARNARDWWNAYRDRADEFGRLHFQ